MSSGSRTRATNNNYSNAMSFGSFFSGWLQRQERFLDELLSAQDCDESSWRENDLKDLVARVLAHYQQYYEEKSRQAHRNIFLLFSPPWFTSFERAYFWIAGFKPALAFRLVSDSVHDLTENQSQKIDRLRGEIRLEEKMLNDELAKIQESVAAPPIMELARRQAQGRDDVIAAGDVALDGLRSETEKLVANADLLRTSTVAKMVEILSPTQNVRFLTAATRLQLKIHSCGLERERNRQETE
ncbi:hypothetical protein JRO89_XS12G0067800 [Xanthoceras sorbifolium]|uniref:DOG1 domain-containing protein n=1 Tax=Xanthoceras sorbifolium TaxID=99658 RepID=A0ABQ8HBK2_9ROSI|nr:hypothetical protein JRO89_XS12G0067800 [Xanthoceras sorbifolium]